MWISFNKLKERKNDEKLTCHCGGVEAEQKLPTGLKK